MILTISASLPVPSEPESGLPDSARDLGYLLHKHPDRVHRRSLAFGESLVFFPEATDARCTMTLLVNVDPVSLVRKARGSANFALQPYVNDRPYAASSFLSVALVRSLGTAMRGECKTHPHLPFVSWPFDVTIPVLPCRGGVSRLQSLFAPLGYEIEATEHSLGEEWGEAPYLSVVLSRYTSLSELLRHLYVLIPVLDEQKHYWIDRAEAEKLLKAGEGWLESHPEKESIVRRYLKFQSGLAKETLRLLSDENEDQESVSEKRIIDAEEPLKLHDTRLRLVKDRLLAHDCKRVLDLGCGEGKLLRLLLREKQVTEVVGVDISLQTLRRASERLRVDSLPLRIREKLTLQQGSLSYRDDRVQGFDGAAVVEVIEHLEPYALYAFGKILFGHTKPKVVVLTTPNAEYNVLFPTLSAGSMRHPDHRFEWTRAEFETWARELAYAHGYDVSFEPVGPVDEVHGAPSQMGVFVRC